MRKLLTVLMAVSAMIFAGCQKEKVEPATYTFVAVGEWPGTVITFFEYDAGGKMISSHNWDYKADSHTTFTAVDEASIVKVLCNFSYEENGQDQELSRWINEVFRLKRPGDVEILCEPETPLTDVEP